MHAINIATEDEIGEVLIESIVSGFAPALWVEGRYRRGGFGYLKKQISSFNLAAKYKPFIVLTDLDAGNCAPELVANWLPVAKHANLIFRVAVREVEAWLLADPVTFSRFTGVGTAHIPSHPEQEPDPKAKLIELVRRYGKADVRRQIVPKASFSVLIGPSYNEALCEFVRNHWNVSAASQRSESLAKAINRIRELSDSMLAQTEGN